LSNLDILKSITYGVVNRTDGSFFDGKTNNDFVRNSPLSLVRQSVREKVTPNVLSKNNEFVAVCLRVLPKEEEKFNFFSVTGLLNSIIGSQQTSTQIKVVARIPEIDAALPIPESESDINAIMNHSVFIGDESVEEPTPGSLIRVTFQDVSNMQGPIYLGPYFKGNATQQTSTTPVVQSNQNLANPNAQGFFQQASQGQQAPAAPQAPSNTPQTIGKPTSFTRDRPTAWDFSKIDISVYERAKQRGINVPTFVKPSEVSTDINKNLYICAAVSEVIEQYWRQIDPGAKCIVTASHRPNDPDDSNHNHIEAAAIDFYIQKQNGEKIAVFQSWGTLFMLIQARRFPFGGCGIYINIHPDGVKGITPALAGASSGNNRRPPGSSAGTHYDFRGFMGFVGKSPIASANRPTIWMGLDELGSGGKDDWAYYQSSLYNLANPKVDATGKKIAESAEKLAEFKQMLDTNVPGARQYFSNYLKLAGGNYAASLNDPELPQVSTSVLNILQVLGFEP
jgi:hypothetical protein